MSLEPPFIKSHSQFFLLSWIADIRLMLRPLFLRFYLKNVNGIVISHRIYV